MLISSAPLFKFHLGSRLLLPLLRSSFLAPRAQLVKTRRGHVRPKKAMLAAREKPVKFQLKPYLEMSLSRQQGRECDILLAKRLECKLNVFQNELPLVAFNVPQYMYIIQAAPDKNSESGDSCQSFVLWAVKKKKISLMTQETTTWLSSTLAAFMVQGPLVQREAKVYQEFSTVL